MPKSILKKTPRPNTAPQALSPEERNRETALYHANLIQQRKDVQTLVLNATEILLDFPTSPISDPAYPSAGDVIRVKDFLKSFQPSDYDLLVKERNINKKCGYVLCARPNRLEGTDAKYRILHDKSKGFHSLKFVERQELERWCSDECGKRALYIRVQLSDEPVWARGTNYGGGLALLEEGTGINALVEGFNKLDVDYKKENIISAMKELAIERGDGKTPQRRSGLAELNIQENPIPGIRMPHPPDPSRHALNSIDGCIEGYNPKIRNGKVSERSLNDGKDEGDDMMLTI